MTSLEEQVSKLSQMEKVRLLETLWSDLTKDPCRLTAPEWHREELRKTEQAIAKGTEYFVDWEEAKEDLRRDEAEDIKHGDQGFI